MGGGAGGSWLGPVIRELTSVEQRGVVGSSDSSEEEYEQPIDYDMYTADIDVETMEALRKFVDPKMKKTLKKSQEDSKAYSSGHFVDIDSLTKLGVFYQVGEYFQKIGWVWLLALDECRIPMIICDEFITSFQFDETTNLTAPSIHFWLFEEQYEMSINEWSIRLDICTRDEVDSKEVKKWERGVPGKQVDWDMNKTWKQITGRKEIYSYRTAQAYHLNDPILRICHIIMVSNVNGLSTAFSRMPSSSLYFLDIIIRGMKVHLGYWLARILKAISNTPSRHLTLCHIVGRFLMRNYEFRNPQTLKLNTPAPRPYTLDITCLLRAGVIREEDGRYLFYEPGETPKEMRNLSGAEQKKVRKLEKRLEKLEDMEKKLAEIEDVIFKTRRSQVQMLTVLNHSQLRQSDSFNAFQGVLTRFMSKVWSMARAKLFDGELEEDPYFDDEVRRTLKAETERESQARRHQAEHEQEPDTTGWENKGKEIEGTTQGQTPDTTNEEEQAEEPPQPDRTTSWRSCPVWKRTT